MYDAFISYSHSKDRPIASALQTVIQTLGKPWWKPRAARVFRDDTSLSATPGLWPTIEKALAASRRLVLIASPQAAQSKWVGREVETWVATKGSDTLLIALTEGDLSWDEMGGDFRWGSETPLPPALKGKFANEPLWADLRAFRSQRAINRRDQPFLAASASLAAAVREMAREDLLSEEVTQQRRNLLWARSAAASLAVLAGAAVWQAIEATHARHVAEEQRDRAQRVLNQITASANARVVAIAERVRETQAAENQIAKIAASGDASQPVSAALASALSRAEGLNGLSQTYLANEDAPSALKAAEVALAALAEGSSQSTDERFQLARAASLRAIGLAQARLGRRDKAAESLTKGLEIFQSLSRAHPEDADTRLQLSAAYQDLADINRQMKQFNAASANYRAAMDLLTPVNAGSSTAVRQQAAIITYKIASAKSAQSEFDAAATENQSAIRALEELAASHPDNDSLQRSLSIAYHLMAEILKADGKTAAARGWLDKDLALTKKLASDNAAKQVLQHDLAVSYGLLGQLQDDVGQHGDALKSLNSATSIGETLVGKDHVRAEWLRDQAAWTQLRGIALIHLGMLEEAVPSLRRALAYREQLAASSTDVAWQRELEDAYRRTRGLLLKNDRVAEALETGEQELFATSLAPDSDPLKPERVARALGSLCWTAILANDLTRALWSCEQAVALAPDLPFVKLNYAHALMYSGDVARAREIYLSGTKPDGDAANKWRDMIRTDFAEFTARKRAQPLMAEISWTIGN